MTYKPGEATVYENGLLLSTGLTSRIIATKDTKVQYEMGGQSSENFHSAPDGKYYPLSRGWERQLRGNGTHCLVIKMFHTGGAVFEDKATGGWIYVSNSESSTSGGVGAITFNSIGEVVGFKSILSGTRRNCGGGKTFFNTWLTCEEADGGQVWEVRVLVHASLSLLFFCGYVRFSHS